MNYNLDLALNAVFSRQEKTIIASANLVVIRPKDKVLGEYIKIFLESPIGIAMIKSFLIVMLFYFYL